MKTVRPPSGVGVVAVLRRLRRPAAALRRLRTLNERTDLSDLDMLSLGRAAAPLGREAASLGRPTADSFDGMEDRFTASVGLVGFAVSFEGAGVTGFLTPVTGVLKVARRGCVDGCPRVEEHARKAVD